MKRILCLIDSLGSGGAQRQMVNLAIALKKKGYDVSFLTYYPSSYFQTYLDSNGIPIVQLDCSSFFKRLINCRRIIRRGKYDVVISFLEIPSLINEISGLPCHKWKIIVGERSAAPRITKTIKGRMLRLFHLLSGAVISNSESNRKLVIKANPLLSKGKCYVINNMYSLDKFANIVKITHHENDSRTFKIVVAASHQKLKNLDNLVRAVYLLDDNRKDRLRIDWYGKKVNPCFQDSINLIDSLNLQSIFSFFPPTKDIYKKMVEADAVGLFSKYEGLPNTICEAMCLGCPVIATDISDNKKLIRNIALLSNPNSPQNIAQSLCYLMDLTSEERKNIGNENKLYAENHFSEENVVQQFISLFG